MPCYGGKIFDSNKSMRQFVQKILGEISLKTILVSLLFLVSVFIFSFIAHEVVKENEKAFDDDIFNFFKTHTSGPLVNVMTIFTFFGSTYFFIPAYILLISFLFIKHRRTEAINVSIIGVSSTALMFGL